jgi:phage tail protein X
MFPACVAWMVHVPAPTSVTVAPDTVQTDVVVEAKLTANPELALALTVNGEAPNTWPNKLPNVIVWLPGVTVKPWLTGVAAPQLLLPPCVAWMVHVPAPTSVTVTPDTVHTDAVVEAKLTANPELALALTANGAAPNT